MSDVDLDFKPAGQPVLQLDNICLREGAKPFSLALCSDEVVVFTGLVGSGKSEFADMLFGLLNPYSGKMTLLGKYYHPATSRDAIRAGVFLCPKDRASNAVIQGFDITENITVPFLSRYSVASFISPAKEHEVALNTIDKLGIVCQSAKDDIDTLSGGNQQKAMVGRWLSQSSKVLVLDEPFQGVDIKARRDIGQKIRDTAKGRVTIVMAAEIDEVLEIADRIIVMSDHTIVGEHQNKNINVNLVLAQVAGQQFGGNQHTEPL